MSCSHPSQACPGTGTRYMCGCPCDECLSAHVRDPGKRTSDPGYLPGSVTHSPDFVTTRDSSFKALRLQHPEDTDEIAALRVQVAKLTERLEKERVVAEVGLAALLERAEKAEAERDKARDALSMFTAGGRIMLDQHDRHRERADAAEAALAEARAVLLDCSHAIRVNVAADCACDVRAVCSLHRAAEAARGKETAMKLCTCDGVYECPKCRGPRPSIDELRLGEFNAMRDVREAYRRKERAKRAVLDWMNAEGRMGNLRQNDQAPGWAEYEAAESAWAEALKIWDEP